LLIYVREERRERREKKGEKREERREKREERRERRTFDNPATRATFTLLPSASNNSVAFSSLEAAASTT
jgi:hypothetical protein